MLKYWILFSNLSCFTLSGENRENWKIQTTWMFRVNRKGFFDSWNYMGQSIPKCRWIFSSGPGCGHIPRPRSNIKLVSPKWFRVVLYFQQSMLHKIPWNIILSSKLIYKNVNIVCLYCFYYTNCLFVLKSFYSIKHACLFSFHRFTSACLYWIFTFNYVCLS